MVTLLAEDLLLLLTDDETGKRADSYLDVLLGGSMLIELAGDGLLEVRRTGRWSQAKVHVLTDPAPPADPLLAEALATVREKERTAQDLVGRLGKGLRDKLFARLVDKGILRLEEGKILGLFPTQRWPAVDSSHENEVRRQLSATLLHGVSADQRTGALISLLHSADKAHKVLDNQGRPAKEIKARAKAVAEGDWAADAVKDAIAAAQAATMTAVMVATTVTTGAGGS
ncbi:hypothetical protein BJ980_001226 [Nocardioides daedukensis]|uniref:GPP34 family phosphoprotein n=1 Tax=Nocardioides daedukensis TaxID=634462 RepID=A0A7Y9UN90_9ACTN|nr:GPP34 family phosphoprotein [Nocardioides daedukensis]NYG58303.1 hypothetical protein [Nocardioides daedukensis]